MADLGKILKNLVGLDDDNNYVREPNVFESLGFMITHGFDTGAYGEFLTKYLIDHNVGGYKKTLNNVYIPYKETTSEIDIIMITEQGIYVIESKNYSGWIFGSADQLNWTQSLNHHEKYKFYNPIWQNRTHIKALSEFLKTDKRYFHSYIVFSERCELKKVPSNTDEYTILKRENLLMNLVSDMNSRNKILSKENIDYIYSMLQRYTNVPNIVKQQHIDHINEKFSNQ